MSWKMMTRVAHASEVVMMIIIYLIVWTLSPFDPLKTVWIGFLCAGVLFTMIMSIQFGVCGVLKYLDEHSTRK